MGKDFVKLGGEDEVRIMFDSLEPGPRGRRRGRMIEAAVDFRGVEIFRDHRQGIELCAGAFGIDAATPIGIRPARGTDMNVAESTHASDLSEPPADRGPRPGSPVGVVVAGG